MVGSLYEIQTKNIKMKDVMVQSPFNLMTQIRYTRLPLPLFCFLREFLLGFFSIASFIIL